MKIPIFLALTALSLNVFAGKEKKHRHHDSHLHGTATLSIAFEQLNGKIEFKAASEGILGFEHEARSEKEKQKLANIIAVFEKSSSQLIQFDANSNCVFTAEKVGMEAESGATEGKAAKGPHKHEHKKAHQGEHSDFVAHYNVQCQKDLKGTQLTLDFSQFKGLRDTDVTLLIGDLQKSIELKRKPVTIELK